MPISNSQLANEYDEIKRRFSASPYIQITATSGNPPESYEITYHVKGISQVTDGRAVIVDSHRVSIVLPFGYPHFPPNCKPFTSIFHPDFDPDAVCIGDFWNSSHSLAELIVHIGRLISYQTFSKEDVFNHEALEWAKANGNLLPLDNVDFNVQAAEEQLEAIPVDTKQDGIPAELLPATGDEQAPPVIEPAAGEGRKKPEERSGKDAPAAGKITGGKNRKPLLAAFCGVLLLAAVAGAMLVLDMRNYDGAVQKWAGVAPLVSQNSFAEADKQVKAVHALLGKVRFIRKGEKQALLQDVKKLTDLQEFKEGLLGKILVNGRYITAQQQQDIKTVTVLLARAQELADSAKWQESGEKYALAAEKTTGLGDLAPLPLDQVEELSKKSRLQGQMKEGNLFRSQQKWDQAQSNYQEALKILAVMQKDEQWEATRSEVQILMTEMAFSSAVEHGDQFFAEEQWSQAADSYENALKMIDNQGGELAREVKKIKGQRDVAGFNSFYEAGLKDFSEGKWDAAINNLDRSEGLLAAARAAGSAREISQKTISRKILSATANRGEAAVAAYLAEEKYSQSAKVLKSIIGAIDRNPLGAEKEFAAARKSASERISRYQYLDDIQQKIAYLHSRYEMIFKDFFSSAARSKLSEPQITFVRQEGNLLIFKMQCLEENRRQKFTLEMNYQYDNKSGNWSPRPHADAAGSADK
jgi:ubiquitin-protein ligase